MITVNIQKINLYIKNQPKLLKSITGLAGGNLAGSILGAIGGVLVARFIDPEVNGQFREFSIPLLYLSVLQLGTLDAVQRLVPLYTGREQPEEVNRVASVACAWNLIIMIVVGFGFVVYGTYWAFKGDTLTAAGWLSQALLCLPLFYGGYLTATYRTLNNFVTLARIQLIQAVLSFLMIYAVVVWGFYGLCVRAVFPALAAILFFQCARPLRIQPRFQFAPLKDLISVGIPLYIWASINTTLWLAAEYSLISYYSGVKWVGIFAVAVIVRESLSILPQSVHQVLMPRVVEQFARGKGSIQATQQILLIALGLCVLMLFTVMVVSFALDYLVPVYLPKYAEGLHVIKLCLWFAVVQAAALPVSTLYARGSWLYGRCILTGFVTFIVFSLFLVPYLGGTTAIVVGSLFGRIARVAVAYVDVYRFAFTSAVLENS